MIIDTSTLVSAERHKHSVRDIFRQLRQMFGEVTAGLSVVTVAELAHGVERAKQDAHRLYRQNFLDDLLADIKVYPVTVEIALRAGQLSGQLARQGVVIPIEDLLIGATALECGFDVVTENVRHFEMIPNLVVRSSK